MISNMFSGLKAIIKIILWIPILVGYLLTCLFWKIVIRDPVQKRRKYAETVSLVSRIVLWYANAKLTVKSMPPKNESFLLVGNHLGIIDIMLLASVKNCLFITSVEMRDTPLLGTLCEMGGCLFVERRNRLGMTREIESIREVLKQGFNVVLYPEGTSTNGEKLLPFKKSLITAAAGTDVPILPMVLNYTSVNGEKMSGKWRNHVFWYGDHTFLAALYRMMSLKEMTAEIEFLNPIICNSTDERREVSRQAFEQVEAKFIPIPLQEGEVSTFKIPKSLAGHRPNP